MTISKISDDKLEETTERKITYNKAALESDLQYLKSEKEKIESGIQKIEALLLHFKE